MFSSTKHFLVIPRIPVGLTASFVYQTCETVTKSTGRHSSPSHPLSFPAALQPSLGSLWAGAAPQAAAAAINYGAARPRVGLVAAVTAGQPP